MSDVFDDQRKFMRACGQSVDDHDGQQYAMYRDLIREEVTELEQAQDQEAELDALIDILVVTVGAIHSMGADGPGAWKEVMRSNFAKIDARTGKVKRREDGKILKPEGWQPPRLGTYVSKNKPHSQLR